MEEYLDSLTSAQVNVILEAMEYLKTFGLELREPHVKHLDKKLYELRAKDKNGIYRVIYFAARNRTFVMLHGFTKKTQKTPPDVIMLAEKRMKEYING